MASAAAKNRWRFAGAISASENWPLRRPAAPLRLRRQRPVRQNSDYAGEARRLTDAIFARFWDREARMFRAPVRSPETVDSDPKRDSGYLFWPTVLVFQALADAERAQKGAY